MLTKRYYFGFLIGFIGAFFLWVVLFTYRLGHLNHDTYWLYDLIHAKEALAKAITGHKILLVGDSHIWYGLSAKLLTQKLEIPVVNMGSCGCLPVDYMLYKTKQLLHSGDTVILSFTYDRFTGASDGWTAFFSRYMLSNDLPFYQHLPFLTRLKVLLSYPLAQLFQDAIDHRTRQQLMSLYPDWMTAKSLNHFGDQTKNTMDTVTPHMTTDIALQAKPEHWVIDPAAATWQYLDDFIRWSHDHQVTIQWAFPTGIFFKSHEKNQAFFSDIRRFFEQHNVAVLGTAFDYFFKKEQFYNSDHHLNQKTQTLLSRRLLGWLKHKA